MTEKETQRIKRIVHAYAVRDVAECGKARAAVTRWVEERQEAWVFERHANDDRLVGNYVLAETAWFDAAQAPAGVGFRTAVLRADHLTIARVAIHEGAHLTGEGEETARRVEHRCLLPLS
jgi:hypothetical protein